jgi:hypothetical protein
LRNGQLRLDHAGFSRHGAPGWEYRSAPVRDFSPGCTGV